jgi:hypothetical protein
VGGGGEKVNTLRNGLINRTPRHTYNMKRESSVIFYNSGFSRQLNPPVPLIHILFKFVFEFAEIFELKV